MVCHFIALLRVVSSGRFVCSERMVLRISFISDANHVTQWHLQTTTYLKKTGRSSSIVICKSVLFKVSIDRFIEIMQHANLFFINFLRTRKSENLEPVNRVAFSHANWSFTPIPKKGNNSHYFKWKKRGLKKCILSNNRKVLCLLQRTCLLFDKMHFLIQTSNESFLWTKAWIIIYF